MKKLLALLLLVFAALSTMPLSAQVTYNRSLGIYGDQTLYSGTKSLGPGAAIIPAGGVNLATGGTCDYATTSGSATQAGTALTSGSAVQSGSLNGPVAASALTGTGAIYNTGTTNYAVTSGSAVQSGSLNGPIVASALSTSGSSAAANSAPVQSVNGHTGAVTGLVESSSGTALDIDVSGTLGITSTNGIFGYIFSSFQNGTASSSAWHHSDDDRVFLFYSPEGANLSLLTPNAIDDDFARDPCLVQSGTMFYLVYTDGWSSKHCTIKQSADLVNWSILTTVDFTATHPEITHVWSPRLFLDGTIWRLTFSSNFNGTTGLYQVSCTDGTLVNWSSMSSPTYVGVGGNENWIVKEAGTNYYRMLYTSNDQQSGGYLIRTSTSSTPSSFDYSLGSDIPNTMGMEGPFVLLMPDGITRRIYWDSSIFDDYGLKYVETTDWTTFSAQHEVIAPIGTGNGSAIPIKDLRTWKLVQSALGRYTREGSKLSQSFVYDLNPTATVHTTVASVFGILAKTGTNFLDVDAVGAGLYGLYQNNTSETNWFAAGVEARVAVNQGTLQYGDALRADYPQMGGGVLGTAAGLRIKQQYGTNATNSYGVYQESGSDRNVFAGPTTIGAAANPGTGLALDVRGNASVSGTTTIGAGGTPVALFKSGTTALTSGSTWVVDSNISTGSGPSVTGLGTTNGGYLSVTLASGSMQIISSSATDARSVRWTIQN